MYGDGLSFKTYSTLDNHPIKSLSLFLSKLLSKLIKYLLRDDEFYINLEF